MIKVHISSEPWSDAVNFYIVVTDTLSGKRHLLQFGKHNQTLVELKEYDENFEPTFRLSGADSHETMKALADAINAKGISTDEDKRREGKLEALQKHLEDMRSLVFKEKSATGGKK